MFALFGLLTVVFLALWFVNFFLTYFKASTSYGLFMIDYVTYVIFARLWFSLNQMFVIKFSVSSDTGRENQTIACFHRGLCSTKNVKRATGHLSPSTDNTRGLKSLLFNMLFVRLMPNKCSCHNLHVVDTVFVLFFFYFSVVCFKYRCLPPSAQFTTWFAVALA